MKVHIALLMPYRIKDVKSLLSKDDIVDWEAYTAFNTDVFDMYHEMEEEGLEDMIDYKAAKKVYISLN